MPTIKLNKTVFEELVGKKLSLEQLKDRISMLGTDLESIEGNEITVEVFPNRPDMLSEQGFARALSSFIGVKTGLKKYEIKKSGEKLFVKKTPEYYPYAIAFIAKNLKLDEEKVRELIQLQDKIGITMLRNRKKGGIGLYPLEKLHFPVTFEGRNPETIKFRPLEYPEALSAREILEKHKKGKEYGHLMKKWDTYTTFVDNQGIIMSMPPIVNSHDVGKIDEMTTNLFVECTGTDFKTINIAINIFATTLIDMGAAVYSIEVHDHGKTFDTPDLTPKKMKLDIAYANKILGLKLGEKEAVSLLERMGYGYEQGEVLIPAYRADILHPIDLVEDIAIAYGYENFEEIIPKVATIGEEDPLEVFLRKIKEILLGFSLLECKNYHLITKLEAKENMNSTEEIVPLQNALGEHNHLRNALLPSLLKNLKENQHHEYPQNLFEIGRIFSYGKTETGIAEHESLAIVLCHEKTDFTEIRQILDALFRELAILFTVKEIEHQSYITGRVGEIVIGEETTGIIGEISPEVLSKWSTTTPVVAFELNIEKVFRMLESK